MIQVGYLTLTAGDDWTLEAQFLGDDGSGIDMSDFSHAGLLTKSPGISVDLTEGNGGATWLDRLSGRFRYSIARAVTTLIPAQSTDLPDFATRLHVRLRRFDDNLVTHAVVPICVVDAGTERPNSMARLIIAEQGLPGPTGPEGPSAYQAWLDAGNVGSETDFLATLNNLRGVPIFGDFNLDSSNVGQQFEVTNSNQVRCTLTATAQRSNNLSVIVPVWQLGIGQVKFQPALGATLLSELAGHNATARQYAKAYLELLSNSDGQSAVWALSGSTAQV